MECSYVKCRYNEREKREICTGFELDNEIERKLVEYVVGGSQLDIIN
jgi:hypothetical protein